MAIKHGNQYRECRDGKPSKTGNWSTGNLAKHEFLILTYLFTFPTKTTEKSDANKNTNHTKPKASDTLGETMRTSRRLAKTFGRAATSIVILTKDFNVVKRDRNLTYFTREISAIKFLGNVKIVSNRLGCPLARLKSNTGDQFRLKKCTKSPKSQVIRATFSWNLSRTVSRCKLRQSVARITTSLRNKFSCCRK